ncbi:MAG: TonB-dependent receptor [Candidatus Omnitrophica bacterium]|nr:TonB-dependent receptor [Candidatus Omnitrophota bacterium]
MTLYGHIFLMKGLVFLLYGVMIFYCTVCPVDRAWSKEADYDRILLDPIVVSPGRSPVPSSRIAGQVEVFTAEDLHGLPARNLAEALNYMPGVDIQNNGPFGQATAVSIRGSNSRQVLVMVDGIPFNTQLSGQANLSRIPLENVAQVEVIKGGDSSAWGSSLGGVINVITKPPGTGPKPHGRLTTSFAQFAAAKNSLELDGKAGAAGYSAFGSFLHADGHLADSRTQEIKNFTKVKYDFNPSTDISASFGYSGAQLRYGPTNAGRIFDQPYISRYGAVELKTDTMEHRVSTAYKYNDQDITTDTYNSSTGARVSSTVSHNFYQGLSFNDVYEWHSDRTLTMGMDFDWHALKSSNYLTKAQGQCAVALCQFGLGGGGLGFYSGAAL